MLLSKIHIGRLDTKIRIEYQHTFTDNISNEKIKEWKNFSGVWAEKMNRGGRLGFDENQQVSNNSATYKIRYSERVKKVDATMRLVDLRDDETYYINVVEKESRAGWILIHCERKDNG